MQYVYVLLNDKGDFYTGCASNLDKRMTEHVGGKSFYTKDRGEYKLIYNEACLNVKDGFSREKYLKSGQGKRNLKNRLKRYLEDNKEVALAWQKEVI